MTAARPLTPTDRRRIADAIEALLAILDADDGDPDLEPSLGWSRTHATTRFDVLPDLLDLEAA